MARKVNKTPGLRPPITLHSPQPTFDTGRSWRRVNQVIGVIPTFNCPAAFTDAHDPRTQNTIRFAIVI
ncbi:hypothetical protein HBH81_182060 [Parastagonospora nodorum]|nr:hypothetical protein HBH84_185340 [Parastagonospora nodorum]KAH4626500.1 hypothetical protein HBH81_182060 [Parastagonospora nodorum]